jgi:hypothetical protein
MWSRDLDGFLDAWHDRLKCDEAEFSALTKVSASKSRARNVVTAAPKAAAKSKVTTEKTSAASLIQKKLDGFVTKPSSSVDALKSSFSSLSQAGVEEKKENDVEMKSKQKPVKKTGVPGSKRGKKVVPSTPERKKESKVSEDPWAFSPAKHTPPPSKKSKKVPEKVELDIVMEPEPPIVRAPRSRAPKKFVFDDDDDEEEEEEAVVVSDEEDEDDYDSESASYED